MSISDKIKTVENKIKQTKAQYNLDRQTANISALSSGNVSKYKFLIGKNVLLIFQKRPVSIEKIWIFTIRKSFWKTDWCYQNEDRGH